LFEWNGTDAWVEKAAMLGSIGSIKTLLELADVFYCAADGRLFNLEEYKSATKAV